MKKRGAPKGNRNAKGHGRPRKKRRGVSTALSLNAEAWEAFQTAAAISKGHELSQDEAKDLWRDLCRDAVMNYVKQYTALELASPDFKEGCAARQ